MKKIELLLGSIKVPLDIMVAFGAFLLSYTIRQYTDLIPGVQVAVQDIPPLHEFIPFALTAALVMGLIFAFQGMYKLSTKVPLRQELLRVIGAVFLWFMVIIGYFFLTREYFFSRLVLVYGVLFTTLGLWLVRLGLQMIQVFLEKKGIGLARVVVIGDGTFADHVSLVFQKERAYQFVGRLGMVGSGVVEYLGSYQQLEDILMTKQVDRVIQASTLSHEMAKSLVSVAKRNHVEYLYIPDLLEVQTTNVDMSVVGSLSLFRLKNTPLDGWGRVAKRALDIVGSVIGVVILSPLWLCTAIAVGIQMKSLRQIIFKQKRYGYRGKLFQFYKFQSMRVGAVEEHEALVNNSVGERKGLLKINHDPRVTTVGKFIRKTSLDELPQLWNVLIGTMSLVGPRPHMPAEIDKLTRDYYALLNVKPGITGLAQISGRSDNDFDDEMRIDTVYVENWSLWMDLSILIKTVWKVVRVEGVQE